MGGIIQFLENKTIQAWVAPLVIAGILGLIGYGTKIFSKKKQVEKNINTYSAAEERLLEILRPFFIQELNLEKEVIEDARKAIIREYKLHEEVFIKIEDIKAILILDILKTRFIKEEDKIKLIKSTCNKFNWCSKSENIDNKPNYSMKNLYLENKYKEIQAYNNSMISIAVTIIISILIFTIPIPKEFKLDILNNKTNSIVDIIKFILMLLVVFLGTVSCFLSFKKTENIYNISKSEKEYIKKVTQDKEKED